MRVHIFIQMALGGLGGGLAWHGLEAQSGWLVIAALACFYAAGLIIGVRVAHDT